MFRSHWYAKLLLLMIWVGVFFESGLFTALGVVVNSMFCLILYRELKKSNILRGDK